MHQILAELCPFENICKLFAAYCLEVLVCKFYFIIGIFLQITKIMAIWASYLFFFFLFFIRFAQNDAIIKFL